MSEQDHIRQAPRDIEIADQKVTIYPATFNRLCLAANAFFDLLKKTQNVEEAKIAGKKLLDAAIAEAGGDVMKVDIDKLKIEANDLIVGAIQKLLTDARGEVTTLLAIMCRPNGKDAKTPAPFDNEDFWMDQATISEATVVISTFVAGIDVKSLLKNVLALKGMA